MNYQRPDPSSPVTIVCYTTGGASLATADGHVWCASNRRRGWHEKTDQTMWDAQYFLTVADALRFARGCGWVGE